MIVTFCGHANYIRKKDDEIRVLSYLETVISGTDVEFYLGGYGRFDTFAYDCAKIYKKRYRNARLFFVSPYLTESYQSNRLKEILNRYDEIIYPSLEFIFPKFAITYRNRYMVDKADILIAYVNHDWGGAYKTYDYARRKNKCIFNLTQL